MQLTERENRVIEHLTLLATSFMVAEEGYGRRDSTDADTMDTYERLAMIYGAKAAGLIIAIACIGGRTPAEVQNEIEAFLEWSS